MSERSFYYVDDNYNYRAPGDPGRTWRQKRIKYLDKVIRDNEKKHRWTDPANRPDNPADNLHRRRWREDKSYRKQFKRSPAMLGIGIGYTLSKFLMKQKRENDKKTAAKKSGRVTYPNTPGSSQKLDRQFGAKNRPTSRPSMSRASGVSDMNWGVTGNRKQWSPGQQQPRVGDADYLRNNRPRTVAAPQAGPRVGDTNFNRNYRPANKPTGMYSPGVYAGVTPSTPSAPKAAAPKKVMARSTKVAPSSKRRRIISRRRMSPAKKVMAGGKKADNRNWWKKQSRGRQNAMIGAAGFGAGLLTGHLLTDGSPETQTTYNNSRVSYRYYRY